MLRTIVTMASLPAELIGATGRRYCFKELLQERRHLGRVWTAMFESILLHWLYRGLTHYQVWTG